MVCWGLLEEVTALDRGRFLEGGSFFVAEFARSFTAAHGERPVNKADFINGDIKADVLSGLA